jgi:hypothetical protein
MKNDKYKIYSEHIDKKIVHTCNMDYQTIKPEELKNLDEIKKIYEFIIDNHMEVLNKNPKIRGIESILNINFEK